jgi:hypothetical protein
MVTILAVLLELFAMCFFIALAFISRQEIPPMEDTDITTGQT